MKVAMLACGHEDFESLDFLKKNFIEKLEGFDDSSHVLVSTCNRLELYFSNSELLNKYHQMLSGLPSDKLMRLEPNLIFKYGTDCFNHICRVAAGLDSIILCESEIQGQVRNCYEKASQTLTLSADMHFIFQKALTIGKQVRANFHFFKGLPDIEHSIVDICRQKFSDENIEDIKVLILGASNINKKIVKHLKQNKGVKSIRICSHTQSHGEEFAKEFEIDVQHWDNKHHWDGYHMIISGASIEDDYIFSKANFEAVWSDKKLIFDLGVPKNIDPLLHQDNFDIVNMEQLDEHVRSQRTIASDILQQVESMVREKTDYHIQSYEKKQIYLNSAKNERETKQQTKKTPIKVEQAEIKSTNDPKVLAILDSAVNSVNV